VRTTQKLKLDKVYIKIFQDNNSDHYLIQVHF